MLSESGGRSLVFFGGAGPLFGVGWQVAVCVLELSKGGVRDDLGVLLRCRCVLLSNTCAVGWIIHVFHDEG